MAARHEHFMPTALLDSQFAALEEPTPASARSSSMLAESRPEIADEISVGWSNRNAARQARREVRVMSQPVKVRRGASRNEGTMRMRTVAGGRVPHLRWASAFSWAPACWSLFRPHQSFRRLAAIAAGFGLTDGELGWLFSGFFWSYALLQIPTGMILDRFGVTWVNRVSTFLVIMSAATAFVSDLRHPRRSNSAGRRRGAGLPHSKARLLVPRRNARLPHRSSTPREISQCDRVRWSRWPS